MTASGGGPVGSGGEAVIPGCGVVELIGNPRPNSRTRGLADALVDALLAGPGLAGPGPAGNGLVGAAAVPGGASAAFGGRQVLELGEIVRVSFGGERSAGTAPPAKTTSGGGTTPVVDPYPDPFAVVRAARLLIVATPTYKGTYTGLLKVFLDRFGYRELAGVVAVPVAVAASEPHRRSVGSALAELLAELGALVPTEPLAVLESPAADPTAVAAEWAGRHRAAIAEALATVV